VAAEAGAEDGTEDGVSIDDVAKAEDETDAVEAREAPITLSLKMRSASI
jgi:hypothetical protein